MTTDDRDVVSAVRDALCDRVGKQKVELWFADVDFALHRAEDGTCALIVSAPHEFKQEVLRTNFASHLRTVAKAILGGEASVRFVIDRQLKTPAAASSADAPSVDAQPAITRSREAPAADSAPQSVNHTGQNATVRGTPHAGRKFADFASLIVGDGNHLAFATAEGFARGDAGCASLFIYGPAGVGKTHLLEATGAAFRRNQPQRRAVYLTAEQFTTQFVEAIRGAGLPSFRRKVRGVDLLVLDDVQFFAGKKATLVELLHTIDALLADGRQLVLAADRAPADLVALGPELMTRLAGGMICRVEPPDFAARLSIARQAAARMRLDVCEEVLSLVARRVTATAREIGGALFRLQAVSRIAGQPIDRHLADRALADLFADYGKSIRLADIHRVVCDVFSLEPDALRSDVKAKHASHPRMLAMWLARKHTRSALAEIGRFFGGRTHTTVLSAQKTVERWLSKSEQLSVADQTWHVEHAIRRIEEKLSVG